MLAPVLGMMIVSLLCWSIKLCCSSLTPPALVQAAYVAVRGGDGALSIHTYQDTTTAQHTAQQNMCIAVQQYSSTAVQQYSTSQLPSLAPVPWGNMPEAAAAQSG
jgi:hypothetical protein